MNIATELATALRGLLHEYDYIVEAYGDKINALANPEDLAAANARQALAAYEDKTRPLAVGDRVRVMRSDYPVSCPEGMETEVIETICGSVCVRGTRQSPSDNGAWTFMYPAAELERIP